MQHTLVVRVGVPHALVRRVAPGLAPTRKLEVLGVTVDGMGGTLASISAREQAATALWFQHQKWLCCRRAPWSHIWSTCTPPQVLHVLGRWVEALHLH